MVIPDKMRLNRFQAVRIPDNCTFFARFGIVQPLESQYSGDTNLLPLQSKLDSVINAQKVLESDMEEYDKLSEKE